MRAVGELPSRGVRSASGTMRRVAAEELSVGARELAHFRPLAFVAHWPTAHTTRSATRPRALRSRAPVPLPCSVRLLRQVLSRVSYRTKACECEEMSALALALAVALALALATAALAALLPLEAELLRAGVGGFAVMNCHLDFPFGIEIPYHLQWDKDGETIFSWYSGEPQPRVADRWGGRVRRVGGDGALGRGSINVSAVRETDSGLYRCRVTFPNRTPPARNNGTFYALEVDGGASIATPPTNVTVLEGERAELECAPRDAGADVQWLRDGAPLARLPELAARALRPPNGSLVLRAASSADPGHYACRVLGPGGAQTAGAYLDVQYKAKVVYAPKERHLPFGKPASLDCHFAANPPLTNLRWEKDGFLFDPYNVPGVFYSRNGSLLFNRVDESHEGEYSCTPYNALGTAGASPGVRVRVQRPPALAARPQPLYVARLGASLALPCAAGDDAPGARVSWTRRDGSELPPGRHRLDDGNLTIVDVAEEDRGVYVCTVSNEAAAVAAESELLVENVPPRAPHNLTVRAAADSLHVAWVPGHNGIEVDYEVWYRERAAGEWRTMRILSRGVTEASLLGLRPATDYELRVLAQDLIGDGLFSKPAIGRTLGDEAEGAGPAEPTGEAEPRSGPAPGPLAVTVRLLDEGALVRWTGAPPGAECSLRWFEGAEPAQGARPLATGSTLHDYLLVGGVEEGAQYWAEVRCGGSAGGAGVEVPAWSRLRAAAAGAAAGALLLALTAGALFWALSRRRSRLRGAPPAPGARPPPPPVPYKRPR